MTRLPSPTSFICAVSLVACFATASFAQPTLTGTNIRGVAPGKTVTLVLQGDKLVHPLRVWTSFPAKVEVDTSDAARKNPKQLTCKVTAAATVPLGIGGLMVANASGCSDPLFVMIDDMASLADNGANHTPTAAQPITPPVAIDGRADGANLDHYKFTASGGQRLAVEVVATRLGSTVDPVVRIMDDKGQELFVVDDVAGLGADCRFAYTFPADGTYMIQIHDNQFRAGQPFRLRVGDFPLIAAPMPLGGRAGSVRRIGFVTTDALEVAPAIVPVPADSGLIGMWQVSARYPGGKSSGITQLVASELPEFVESEPNDKPADADDVTIPAAFNGVLLKENERDHFRFAARKGQKVNLTGRARSLGTPVVLFMQVLQGGRTVASSPLSAIVDPNLTFTCDKDGIYEVMVEDLMHRGGTTFAYRVEARVGNSFALRLKSEKTTTNRFVAAANRGFGVNLECLRTGYDGPIKLRLESTGHGSDAAAAWRLQPSVIGAKAKAARVLILPVDGSSVKEGQLHCLRIVGEATVDGRQTEVQVETDAWLKGRWTQMAQRPAWTNGLFAIAVGKPATAAYSLSMPKAVLVARELSTAELVINANPVAKDFKSGVTIEVAGLPAGYTSTIKTEKTKHTVTIKSPPTATDDRFTAVIRSRAEHGGQAYLVEQPLRVDVVSALQVELAAVPAIKAGAKQKVQVRIRRGPGPNAPVILKWKNLPAGLTGAAAYTIPADRDSLELELTADKAAKPIKAANVILEATTRFDGRDVTISSAAAAVEIKK